MNQKHLIYILIGILVAAAAIYFTQARNAPETIAQPDNSAGELVTYGSDWVGVCLTHPKEFAVREDSDGDGRPRLVLEAPSTDEHTPGNWFDRELHLVRSQNNVGDLQAYAADQAIPDEPATSDLTTINGLPAVVVNTTNSYSGNPERNIYIQPKNPLALHEVLIINFFLDSPHHNEFVDIAASITEKEAGSGCK